MQDTIERPVARILATIARMRSATVLIIATMAAAFIAYAVLTDSEEEEDEETMIKRPDSGWLKRRQERGGLKKFSKNSGLKTSLKNLFGLITQPSVVLSTFCDQLKQGTRKTTKMRVPISPSVVVYS